MFHVLVAEDEIWIRNAITGMIEKAGNDYTVIGEAADGEEAWELINQLWPTILVTDIVMPKKDGLWLAQQIADHYLPIVPIVISGHDNFRYAQTAMRYGVAEYLLKPVSEDQLDAALKRCSRLLASRNVMRENLLEIQGFMDSMPDVDEKALIAGQDKIVMGILQMEGSERVQRNALLSVFDSKLADMYESIGYTYNSRPLNLSDNNSIRAYFKTRVETLAIRYKKSSFISNRQIINEAHEFIDAHYDQDLKLQEVAKHVRLSISRFSTIFKKDSNDTFVNYLNKVRIEKAKIFLLGSDDRVYEIAEKVGFISLQYFSRVFKNVTGLSPNEYRKKGKQY